MKVPGYGGEKVLWEVVDNHYVEYPKENYEIGMWGFYFNLFDEDEVGGGGGGGG